MEYRNSTEGSLVGNYVYVNGERVAKFVDNSSSYVQYYLTDHLGSTVATVASNGSVTSRNLYRPWGEKAYGTVYGPGNQFQYTGHYLDEELPIDWYYCGARYYDPELKIFTSVDPKWDADPGWGSYVYCRNNPLGMVDPSGEDALDLAVGFAKGIWEAAKSTVSDLGGLAEDLCTDPRATVENIGEGIGFAIRNPKAIAEAVGTYVSTTWNAGDEGKGELIGQATFAVLTTVFGTKGVDKLSRVAATTRLATKTTAASRVSYSVYRGFDKLGSVRYVGATSRLPGIRFGEHFRAVGTGRELLEYRIFPGATNLTKAEARVLEQTLISQYGFGSKGGQLLNKYNSIGPKYWAKFGIH